jgi:hypothetical protein
MLIAWLLAVVILPTSMTPAPRQIGAFHFDAQGKSEVWINLEPEALQPGPRPAKLNITASFPGKRIEHAPTVVELRVESIGSAYPNQVRQPVFRVTFDNGVDLDLADQAHAFQFIASCVDCSFDTVIARVPFPVLRDLTSPGAVIYALGFSLRLQPADVVALKKYVDTLAQGVAIR